MTTEQESDILTLQKGAEQAPLIAAALFEKGSTRDCMISVPEIIYLSKGTGRIDFEDKTTAELESGRLYILAAGRILLRVNEEIHLILCRVTEESAIPFDDDFKEIEDAHTGIGMLYASIEVNSLLRHFFEGMSLYLDNKIDDEKLLKAKIAELFLIIRYSLQKCDYIRCFSTLLSRKYLFIMFVCKHAASVPTVAQLAELTNMSPRMLNNRFREYLNISPKEFILRERVKSIREKLLTSDMPIMDIACDYGMSVQYLSYLCKREFGMTPTEIRSKKGCLEQEMILFSENHK